MLLKLGKKAVRHDPRTMKMRAYLATLPPTPTAIDWSGKVPSWGVELNDQLGCCTCSAAGHLEMLWTSQASQEFAPADSDILTAYEAVGGYNPADPSTDNGADEITVLNYWRNTGIAGRKITAYAQVEHASQADVQAAIAFFGGCYIGVQFPESAMDAFNQGQIWGNVQDTDIEGGHALPLVAYDAIGPTCVTWGRLQKMTWAWFQRYCDEAYCAFSPDWISAGGTAPSSFNAAQLQADLAALNQ